MIKSLVVEDASRACMPWWSQVSALSGVERLDFTPGLNILWGPNGCGKSTVIRSLARMLHCEQGGVQVVTHTSSREVSSSGEFLGGVLPEHDGGRAVFFDPSDTVGLIGGSFDWDFGMEGMQNAMFKGSHGETTMWRGNVAFGLAMGKEPPALVWKEREPEPEEATSGFSEHQLSYWRLMRRIQEVLGDGSGRPVFLLDEPDKSLDARNQHVLWKNVAIASKRWGFQVIASSHSVFALGLPGANYIELVPGHMDTAVSALRALMVRFPSEGG